MMSTKANKEGQSSFAYTLRSLRYRNFRLFISGYGISLIGTWAQNVAMGWLVYRLTGSEFLLGVVSFAETVPTLLLTVFAGVLADKWSRHRLLIFTQTSFMILAFILAILVLTNTVAVWHIVLISLLFGIVSAVDVPTRQSFWVDIVDNKEDLGNAIALNSAIFNLARLIGPTIAGFLIVAVGEGMCFLINAISFLAVIIALLAMRITYKPQPSKATGLEQLKEGFTYAFGFAPIRYILLLVGFVSLMGTTYTVILPVVAKDVLQGGAQTLGYLMSCAGAGALIGAIFIASQKKIISNLVKNIILSASFVGCGLIVFSLSRILLVSLAIMVVISIAQMVYVASCNTLVQTLVDDDKRGRVMSIYMMAFIGMGTFGSLLVGAMASKLGAPVTIMIGGICMALGAISFASKRHLITEALNTK